MTFFVWWLQLKTWWTSATHRTINIDYRNNWETARRLCIYKYDILVSCNDDVVSVNVARIFSLSTHTILQAITETTEAQRSLTQHLSCISSQTLADGIATSTTIIVFCISVTGVDVMSSILQRNENLNQKRTQYNLAKYDIKNIIGINGFSNK